MSPDVSALILAGGRATRLGGVAKHELVVDGETIFARQCRVLAPRVAEILVAAPRDVAGYRTVRDPIEGAGPLAGIAAGLAAVRTPWLLVVAGDMPNLAPELIDDLVTVEDAFDAIGVRAGGLPEPLLCTLHVRVREVVERRLAARTYKASGLLTDESLSCRWIAVGDPHALRNINTPADLEP